MIRRYRYSPKALNPSAKKCQTGASAHQTSRIGEIPLINAALFKEIEQGENNNENNDQGDRHPTWTHLRTPPNLKAALLIGTSELTVTPPKSWKWVFGEKAHQILGKLGASRKPVFYRRTFTFSKGEQKGRAIWEATFWKNR